jgi:hypothetical protein
MTQTDRPASSHINHSEILIGEILCANNVGHDRKDDLVFAAFLVCLTK